MADAYALVRQAILDRHQVVGTYHGHRREMCPHVIGVNRDGRRQCLFFQFAGSTKDGLPPGGEWRCIPVDELVDVSCGPGEWHTRGYNSAQRCVVEIDVEVESGG